MKIQEHEEEFRAYKREQDDSSISKLRIEIAKRDEKILENERQFQQFNKQKNKYKTNIQKLKQEISKLEKIIDQDKENRLREKEDEMNKIRLERKEQELKYAENTNLTTIKEQLINLANKSKILTDIPNENKSITIPNNFQPIIDHHSPNKNNIFSDHINNIKNDRHTIITPTKHTGSELERLKKEKASLLETG